MLTDVSVPTRPFYADLPADLHRSLKDLAYDRRESMAAVMIGLLKMELDDPRLPPPGPTDEEPEKPKRPRGRPRKGA